MIIIRLRLFASIVFVFIIIQALESVCQTFAFRFVQGSLSFLFLAHLLGQTDLLFLGWPVFSSEDDGSVFLVKHRS